MNAERNINQTNYEIQTFSYEEFDPIHLTELKRQKGISVSVAIPTLNEEKTIGPTLDVLKENLMNSNSALIDELIIVDSGSKDKTGEEVKKRGIRFVKSENVLSQLKSARGKGENLWKSLFLTEGDLLVWIDADALNPVAAYVYGLLGPLIMNDNIKLTKAYFLRYTGLSAKLPNKPNGGRVTEILARPLLNLLFPELAYVYQPYNGNIAGRREVFESLKFPTGYSVDLSILIDVAMQHGTESIAQVYCGNFEQEGQDLQGLGRMGFQALRTVLYKAQEYNRLSLHSDLPSTLIQFEAKPDGKFDTRKRDLTEVILPPVIEIKKRAKNNLRSLESFEPFLTNTNR